MAEKVLDVVPKDSCCARLVRLTYENEPVSFGVQVNDYGDSVTMECGNKAQAQALLKVIESFVK